MVEHCIIISLNNRLLTSLKDQISSWNIQLHIVNGVDLRNKDDAISQSITNNRLSLNASGLLNNKRALRGELGCYYAHYKAWDYLIQNNLDSCIILEEGINIIQKDISNIDINQDIDLTFINKEMQQKDDNFIGYGLQGYVLSKSGAQKLTRLCYTLHLPIDLQIRNLCTVKKIKAHVSSIPYVSRNHERESTIRDKGNPLQDIRPLYIRIINNLINNGLILDNFI